MTGARVFDWIAADIAYFQLTFINGLRELCRGILVASSTAMLKNKFVFQRVYI